MGGLTSTATVAKRSLGHFAVGRIFSAAIGICTLLLLVRALQRSDYGMYIALFASFEILQLAASPGAYAIVFRYCPNCARVVPPAPWCASWRVSRLTGSQLLACWWPPWPIGRKSSQQPSALPGKGR